LKVPNRALTEISVTRISAPDNKVAIAKHHCRSIVFRTKYSL
jgi:hypothetical protein